MKYDVISIGKMLVTFRRSLVPPSSGVVQSKLILLVCVYCEDGETNFLGRVW
jgi:hypothetical protein